jgi:hypothetical protein
MTEPWATTNPPPTDHDDPPPKGHDDPPPTPRAGAAPIEETADMLPQRGEKSQPRVHQVHRRPFGLGPVPLLGGLAAGLLLVAVILFAVGSWVPALFMLGVSAALVALLVVALEQEPDARSARLAIRVAARARGWARFGAVTIRVWSRTGLQLARLRGQRLRLRTAFRQRLKPLGDAVYREDQGRAEVLKAQASDLSQALRAADAEAAKVLGAARERVERERVAREESELA